MPTCSACRRPVPHDFLRRFRADPLIRCGHCQTWLGSPPLATLACLLAALVVAGVVVAALPWRFELLRAPLAFWSAALAYVLLGAIIDAFGLVRRRHRSTAVSVRVLHRLVLASFGAWLLVALALSAPAVTE